MILFQKSMTLLDVFSVDGIKLDDSFPNSQFILENFQFRPYVGIETQKEVESWFT